MHTFCAVGTPFFTAFCIHMDLLRVHMLRFFPFFWSGAVVSLTPLKTASEGARYLHRAAMEHAQHANSHGCFHVHGCVAMVLQTRIAADALPGQSDDKWLSIRDLSTTQPLIATDIPIFSHDLEKDSLLILARRKSEFASTTFFEAAPKTES